ncbi:MAG: acetyl/propionyl-CoA carboxylase subunit alpha [Microbacteriaceae bacterium]|nr:acetyl/propionyl-CoA carboxylase subunit alpha [Microbacteriaceae bacterium]
MSAVIESVLVANRGEIACRIIRTLRRMGIRSIAVYSDADRGALHVSLADVAIRIGPAPALDSYLDIAAIVAAAVRAGADAIHPGYGFLSENVELARATDVAGLVFIGPRPAALEVMGDKIRAKLHVVEHGVPVISGIAEPGLSDDDLVAAAPGVGYPLLIKPSAGGGGKGMQVVTHPRELEGAIASARRVAASAFGDDTLFLERLIAEPRHIEVQVLADEHGAVVHLGERECSLQRRHQKVIEEAPSPLLDTATRRRIGEAACAVARSVDYSGAGTVEFLVSAAAPDEFFFMEMNTRLQVEHPVTELVTGIDLVEWQVRVAAGQPLDFAQSDVRSTGHAVEARLYAEDPRRDFLPGAGTVVGLEHPSGDGIRTDTSLAMGVEVGAHYDPLLAKIIAHGSDRAEALDRLTTALAGTRVFGVTTNLEFLHNLLADADVRAGRLDTGLIERWLRHPDLRVAGADEMAAAALWLHSAAWADASSSPWSAPSGWRLGAPRPVAYDLVAGQLHAEVAVEGAAHDAIVTVDGVSRRAGIRVADGAATVELDGVVTTWHGRLDGGGVWLAAGAFSCFVRRRSRAERVADDVAALTRTPGAGSPEVRVPMPGTVVALGISSGEPVEAGQLLLTVEAMKMEHKLLAGVAGTATLNVSVGDVVALDQLVATITPPPRAPADEGEKP